MARRLVFVLPLLLALGLGAYLTRGLYLDPNRLPSALIDKPVPPFALPPLAGRAAGKPADGLKSADLGGGEVQVVNFFASWCVPCRAEAPLVAALAREVPVNAINYKDKPDDALAFLRQLGDPYRRIGVDAEGRAGIDFGIYGVPETFVIDRDGRIRYRFPGPLDPDEAGRIEALVKSLRK